MKNKSKSYNEKDKVEKIFVLSIRVLKNSIAGDNFDYGKKIKNK